MHRSALKAGSFTEGRFTALSPAPNEGFFLKQRRLTLCVLGTSHQGRFVRSKPAAVCGHLPLCFLYHHPQASFS